MTSELLHHPLLSDLYTDPLSPSPSVGAATIAPGPSGQHSSGIYLATGNAASSGIAPFADLGGHVVAPEATPTHDVLTAESATSASLRVQSRLASAGSRVCAVDVRGLRLKK